MSGDTLARAREAIRSLRRMREGSYESVVNGQTVTTPFTDEATIRDVADLLVALPEEHESGSPSLLIAQVRSMAASLESGAPLSPMQQQLLGRLLAAYAKELAALRSDPRRENFLDVPPAGTGRRRS